MLLDEQTGKFLPLTEYGKQSPSGRRRKGGNTTHTDPQGRVHTVTNRDMNDETYALRRKVMEYIYRARNLTNRTMMRITIRIADMTTPELKRSDILGLAQFGSGEIWIPARTIEEGYDLQEITYHEILHSAYNIGHIPESPIMNPYSAKGHYIPPEILDQIFVSHVQVRDPKKWVAQFADKFRKYLL
jgi:hypothetical protein